ncbi:SEC-C metal-binding domain-containing protein [Clostridium grantii]|uniref:SEC-C motif-containing protein n=1 Tax=Clostridium grantii DSM 8605 TaxID=1121316 RepID=A0A1M5W6P7_9CLOT|nr:SEC-C metal-binding domain-containing protein [Clostridium grantii]SHH82854.1 SEC-C motif-containing protein [Clostridium grantii DSM 8605]
MSLYKQWNDMVVEFVKANGEAAFWDKYEAIEKGIYIGILSDHNKIFEGKVGELAEKLNAPLDFFIGFLDGINESLNEELDMENLKIDTEIKLDIDLARLYFNMLDAKAEYLYNLSQWEGIFSEEKRKEITKAWRESKIVIKEPKIGRNDPCTCGSGRKYKKCCGKNA